MPLLDHFHPPLLDDPPWTSLYTLWVAGMVRRLNQTLPPGEFRAFANVRLGPHVEADVAEYRRPASSHAPTPGRNGGALTLALPAAPPVVASVPLVFPDDVEVQIAEGRHHMTIAGVIEFVSPGNKKETGERRAFVAKCAAYLHRGIGVAIVDVVTNRLANLHNDLMHAVGGSAAALPADAPTYVAGYAPVFRDDRGALDVWCYPAPIGALVPSVPLALRRGPLLMLDLDATYTDAIADSGL